MLDPSVRQLISDYVAAQSSFREFVVQFAPATWDLSDADDETRDLAASAELLMAEFTNGHRTEDELRSKLSDLLGAVLHIAVRLPVGVALTTIHRQGAPVLVWDVASAHRSWRTTRAVASNASQRREVRV